MWNECILRVYCKVNLSTVKIGNEFMLFILSLYELVNDLQIEPSIKVELSLHLTSHSGFIRTEIIDWETAQLFWIRSVRDSRKL